MKRHVPNSITCGVSLKARRAAAGAGLPAGENAPGGRLVLPSWCFVLCFGLALVPGLPAAEPGEQSLLDGTWSWPFVMRDGSRIEPRAKLKQKGDTVSGVSMLQPGQETPILNGKIEGQMVQWTVVRQHNGRKVTTRYEGKLAGDTLKGFIESDWAGSVQRYDWEAHRAPATPTGTWRWASVAGVRRANDVHPAENGRDRASSQNSTDNGSRGGSAGARAAEVRGTFKVEGERVTGKISSSGPGVDIRHGRFRNGEFTFQIIRERDGERSTTQYRGKLEGDTIKGVIESESEGEKKTRPWEATRVEE